MAGSDPFLFVSHVMDDRKAALEIVEELERRGVPCWIAPRDIGPGRPFDDEIAEAIEASRAVLLVFSEHCNTHEYIRREVTVAGESHKVIIPFRIDDAPPRGALRVRLSDLHWIDGFASRKRAIDQVVRTFDPDRARRREDERRRRQEEAGRRQQGKEQRLRQEEDEQRRRQAAQGRRQHEKEQQRRQQEAEPAVRGVPAQRPEDHLPAATAGDATIVVPHRLSSPGESPAAETAPAAAPATEPGIDAAVLTALQRHLARHVGPIAKVLVDSAAHQAQSVEELCGLLAERIDSPKERRDFLREARRECSAHAAAAQARRLPATAGDSGFTPLGSAGSALSQTVLPPATVKLALAELGRVVGPIAHTLVRRALPSCPTAAELWARLAEHIEQPAERAAFMRRQPR